jgi:hypothetical protein
MSLGDHIKVKRRLRYYHHGIDIGKNRVIHFTGEPGRKKDASIEETSLEEFLNGGKIKIVKYSECFNPQETVEIAKKFLSESGYNLFWNNCEHFARYCKTGEKKSEQVKDALAGTGASLGSGGAAVSSIFLVKSVGYAGLSGAGIVSGLATIGPAGVIGGVLTVAAGPAAISNIAMSKFLKDDKKLSNDEKVSRKAGRLGTKVGTLAGAAGTVGSISGLGTVSGLSATGITTGLGAIGSIVGGGMVAGTIISVAAPGVVGALTGYGCYKLFKKIKRKKGDPA